MTVAQLRDRLARMPQDAEVYYAFDGAVRGEADVVWLARSDCVVLAGIGDPMYYEQDLPVGASLGGSGFGAQWKVPPQDEIDQLSTT